MLTNRKIAYRRQRGVSLLTTLVMMTMVMLLGVSAIMLSKGQFSLSGNLQFQSAAFNEAEAAVAAAERWLATDSNYRHAAFTTSTSGTGLFPIGSSTPGTALTMTWSSANSVQAGNANQRYLIEQVALDKTLIPTSIGLGGRTSSACNKVNIYRVIGRGESGRGSQRFIQSVFSVLSC